MRLGNKQNAGLNRSWGQKVKKYVKHYTSKRRRNIAKCITKKEMREDGL